DIVDRLRPVLPGDCGRITLFIDPDSEPMDRYAATLESLGLDSQECEMYYRADAAANTFQSLLPEVKDVKQKPNEIDQAEWDRRTCIELEHVMRSHLEYAMEEMSCVNKRDICEMKALVRPP
ncbi:unnamed protein product, partial [Symbiodinium pilosum]